MDHGFRDAVKAAGLTASSDWEDVRGSSDRDPATIRRWPRPNITVLDVDVADQKVLDEASGRHGDTPILVRTASGKFHAGIGTAEKAENETMAGATDRPARRRLCGGAAIDQAGRCQI